MKLLIQERDNADEITRSTIKRVMESTAFKTLYSLGVNDERVDKSSCQWWPVRHYYTLFISSMFGYIDRELNNIMRFCVDRRWSFSKEQMNEFTGIRTELRRDRSECAIQLFRGRVFYSTIWDVVTDMSRVENKRAKYNR